MDINVCKQLEVGLLKPDLQVYLRPADFDNYHYDHILTLEPEIKIIHCHPNSAVQNSEEVIKLIECLSPKKYNEFEYFQL